MKKNMKNDFFRKGIEGIRNIQLSPEERGVVLSRLLEHAEKHSAVVSPWKIYLSRFQVKYAIVGVLIVLFGGGSFFSIFPLRGLVSDNWTEMGLAAKVADYLWHMVLPVLSSTVGSLAVMTLLTKNSFLEEVRKQYVLTARAKGLSENQVLYRHVFRNAIIPIITGFPGSFITAFFTGSLLIETIFSLDGMGLLAYESILNRDYPVVLGTLYFFTIIGLISRLLSDLSYVVVDPRISFESVESR